MQVTSWCRVCAAWCGVKVDVENGVAVRLIGNRDDPVSRGYVCPKGRKMLQLADDPRRLDEPLVRNADGKLVPVDWDTAIGDLGQRLGRVIDDFDPYAVALYTGTVFDMAGRAAGPRLLNAIGSSSIYTSASLDSVAKMLVTRLMAGNEWIWPAFDFDETSLLLIIGENMVVSHGAFSCVPDPIRYLRSIAQRGEVWVLDPRRTETARLATHHLTPRAGTDYAILAYLVRELFIEGADHEYLASHARNTEHLRTAVQPFDLATTERVTGVSADDLAALLAGVRRHGRLAVQTGTGASMATTANMTEWLAFALQIVTGSFERPGGRWFNHRATYDPNARGSRDPQPLVPGPRTRPGIPRLAGEFPTALLPAEIEAGHVRALLVNGGNPMRAFPQPTRVAAALDNLDVLAVWDIVRTPTTERATHVFPCLDALERPDVKIPIQLSAVYAQYTPAVITPRANRRAIWWSMAKLAVALGVSILPGGLDPDQCSDEEVLELQVAGSPIDWEQLLATDGPVLYPRYDGWVQDTVLPDGRWDLAPAPLVPQLVEAIARPIPPLVLGNRREMQHQNSLMTWSVGDRPAPEPFIYVHPDAAADAGAKDGQLVEVTSQHGVVTGVLRVDDAVARGTLVIPHGFSEPNVSYLTAADIDVDPLSGMPTLIGIPVTLRAVAEGQ